MRVIVGSFKKKYEYLWLFLSLLSSFPFLSFTQVRTCGVVGTCAKDRIDFIKNGIRRRKICTRPRRVEQFFSWEKLCVRVCTIIIQIVKKCNIPRQPMLTSIYSKTEIQFLTDYSNVHDFANTMAITMLLLSGLVTHLLKLMFKSLNK